MAISVNRGMYFEQIITNTQNHYADSKRLMFFKRELPLKIRQFLANKSVIGQISENALVDYFGLYEGHHFEFEAKQTGGERFALSNLHQHQFNHLKAIWETKGIAFLLVYFVKYQTCYLVEFPQINLIWTKEKSLAIDWFKHHGQLIEMVFPGYLDLINYFERRQKRANLL